MGDQEPIDGDAQGTVVVESWPSAALVVTEPDFLLEVLVIALDAPAHLGEIDQTLEFNLLIDG